MIRHSAYVIVNILENRKCPG